MVHLVEERGAGRREDGDTDDDDNYCNNSGKPEREPPAGPAKHL